MTAMPTFIRRIRVIFHSLVLSCLGFAIFLKILVFADIIQQGYFMAVEQNPAILTFEVALTGFAAKYFVYIYQCLMPQVK